MVLVCATGRQRPGLVLVERVEQVAEQTPREGLRHPELSRVLGRHHETPVFTRRNGIAGG
jgi:hypothetical protein